MQLPLCDLAISKIHSPAQAGDFEVWLGLARRAVSRVVMDRFPAIRAYDSDSGIRARDS